MEEKYNILFVNANSGWAGGEISLFADLEKLDKRFTPILLAPSEGPLVNHARRANIETIIIPMHYLTRRTSPLKFINTVFMTIKIIKEKNISLVYVNDLFANQFTLPAAKLSRVPLLCHIRVPVTKRHILANFITYSNMIVCVSESVGSVFSQRLKRKGKVRILYSGIDIKKFQTNSDLKKILDINRSEKVLSIVGSIEPRKGHKYLIEAVPDIISAVPNVKFLMIGRTEEKNKPYKEELLRLIGRLGLEKMVVIVDFIEDIPNIMNTIDILILPSLEEAFGRVLIEAMAASKPVVATKVDGIPEAVIDKQTGILVPPKDSKALANAIIYLLKDPDIAKKMGIEGRKRVERFFNIEETSKKIQEIMLELLTGEQYFPSF